MPSKSNVSTCEEGTCLRWSVALCQLVIASRTSRISIAMAARRNTRIACCRAPACETHARKPCARCWSSHAFAVVRSSLSACLYSFQRAAHVLNALLWYRIASRCTALTAVCRTRLPWPIARRQASKHSHTRRRHQWFTAASMRWRICMARHPCICACRLGAAIFCAWRPR